MSFKQLNMIQEVFQRVKTRDFVTYLQAGAHQSSQSAFISSYRILTPQICSCPKKAILEISEKIEFGKNGPRMQLYPPGCYPDHLEWMYTKQKLYICIFIHIKKKILSEGSLGLQILKNLSQRDYLQRGVKTGISYPHTRLTTCIRVTKIPVWPTIVAENKDFCQHHLQL